MLFNDAVSIPVSLTLNVYMIVNNVLWSVLRSGRDIVWRTRPVFSWWNLKKQRKTSDTVAGVLRERQSAPSKLQVRDISQFALSNCYIGVRPSNERNKFWPAAPDKMT